MTRRAEMLSMVWLLAAVLMLALADGDLGGTATGCVYLSLAVYWLVVACRERRAKRVTKPLGVRVPQVNVTVSGDAAAMRKILEAELAAACEAAMRRFERRARTLARSPGRAQRDGK